MLQRLQQTLGNRATRRLVQRTAAPRGPAPAPAPAAAVRRPPGSLFVQRKLVIVDRDLVKNDTESDEAGPYTLVAGYFDYGIVHMRDEQKHDLYYDTKTDQYTGKSEFEAWVQQQRDKLLGLLAPPQPPPGKGQKKKARAIPLNEYLAQDEKRKLAATVPDMTLDQLYADLSYYRDPELQGLVSTRAARRRIEQEERQAEESAQKREAVEAKAQVVIDWALNEAKTSAYTSYESYPAPVSHAVAGKVGKFWGQQAPTEDGGKFFKVRFRMPHYKEGTGLVTGNLELLPRAGPIGEVGGKAAVNIHLPIDPDL